MNAERPGRSRAEHKGAPHTTSRTGTASDRLDAEWFLLDCAAGVAAKGFPAVADCIEAAIANGHLTEQHVEGINRAQSITTVGLANRGEMIDAAVCWLWDTADPALGVDRPFATLLMIGEAA